MIGLVTYAKAPDLTDDDRPLIAALRQLGVEGRAVRWDDTACDWGKFSALVLRSPWDYHLRVDEFRAWLSTVEAAGVPLFNPIDVVRWNMHKGYLSDLEREGVTVPPTRWIRRGGAVQLSAVMDLSTWDTAIVKPAVSASATDTWRTSGERRADNERFAELVARADVLVQPVIPEVISRGEWSILFIDGAFTHSVIKRPKSGDFRVQTELGGSAQLAVAPESVVQSAQSIVAKLPARCLYTRVDGVETDRGFMLMEVEAIEPLLFLAMAPHACEAMARAIARFA